MLYFEVIECSVKGCNAWRAGNTCALHGNRIVGYVELLKNYRNQQECQIRKQVDMYRLNNLLEN